MTTTQGRLLVTCVGGFACTEWELHNRLNRERVFGSAQQFEMRINFMNLVMEQLQSMWWKMVRWLCFFSSRPASVILTHYIIAVDLTTALRFSAVPETRSWPVSGAKKKCLWYVPVLLIKAPWHPLTDPQAPCRSAWGRKSRHLMWRGPLLGWDRQSITLRYISSLLLSPVMLAYTTEMQVSDLSGKA